MEHAAGEALSVKEFEAEDICTLVPVQEHPKGQRLAMRSER